MVEEAGLVKFDFLGLKTLTVIETAVKLIKRRGIEIDPLNPARRPEDLRNAVARRSGRRVPVESAGMRKALLGMKPDQIEDIIALVALYRPGPMENIPTYNARKHGRGNRLDPSQDRSSGGRDAGRHRLSGAGDADRAGLAGYTLGEADLLRRAMGKKIRAEMDQQRERFVTARSSVGYRNSSRISSSICWRNSRTTASTNRTPPPMRSSPYQTAYLKARITRSSSWPRR
jgi:DNA polymerase-3 subunit alpha